MINRRVLRVLFLAIFSSMLGASLVVPLLPSYAHNLGATGFRVGLIFTTFSLSRNLLVPVFGHWSDAKGRKPFITCGLFAYFVAFIVYIFSNVKGSRLPLTLVKMRDVLQNSNMCLEKDMGGEKKQ